MTRNERSIPLARTTTACQFAVGALKDRDFRDTLPSPPERMPDPGH